MAMVSLKAMRFSLERILSNKLKVRGPSGSFSIGSSLAALISSSETHMIRDHLGDRLSR